VNKRVMSDAGAAPGAPARPPGIIFILTDDLGWGDLGCYGNRDVRTPRLDRMAAEGLLFTDFHVASPVCSPSRAAFMTGQYPSRLRIHHAIADPLGPEEQAAGMRPFVDPDVLNLQTVLKTAGYACAHFGKWHLGGGQGAPEPTDYGFDATRVVNGRGPTWDTSDPYFRARSTGLMVDEAIGFIRQNRDRPFYINIWTQLPHAVLNPTPEQLEPWLDLHKPVSAPYPGATAIYYASLEDLDTQVGRLLDALDEMGLGESTLVLFSSDNGPEDIHIRNASHSSAGSPGPFRGRKRSLYEGGIRMPFIARMPGRVPAGRVDDACSLAAVDLLPTLASAAGAPLPPDAALDGEDLTEALFGRGAARKKDLFWEWRFGYVGEPIGWSPALAVREGSLKLLMNPDGGRVELYDLAADPSEVDNVAASRPEDVSRLRAKLDDWRRELPPGCFSKYAGDNSYPWPRGA